MRRLRNRFEPFRRLGLCSLLAAGMAGGMSLSAPRHAAAGIAGSKHDLSTPFGYSDQVCAFCHTPHSVNTAVPAPLWNRFVDGTKVFAVYQSATMDTIPSQPHGTLSGVCLGCHDGTLGSAVVNGYSGSDKHDLVNAPGPGGVPDLSSEPNCQRCHGEFYGGPPADWQGTDLSNDHPITVVYPTTAQDPKFHPPPDPGNGWDDVKLYAGKIECPTCHSVHDPFIVPFLRRSNDGSGLCLTCHVK